MNINPNIIYWIGVVIMTAIYVVSAKNLAIRSYRKGRKDGEYNASRWLAIALAGIVDSDDRLQKIMTQIAENLNAIKNDIADDPGTTQEGGDQEQ